MAFRNYCSPLSAEGASIHKTVHYWGSRVTGSAIIGQVSTSVLGVQSKQSNKLAEQFVKAIGFIDKKRVAGVFKNLHTSARKYLFDILRLSAQRAPCHVQHRPVHLCKNRTTIVTFNYVSVQNQQHHSIGRSF